MDFRSIVGHDHQKALFSSLVERNKLPHALMFSGPKGVGKATLAFELVKNLFCAKKMVCGTCRPCRNLASGTHPDFTLVKTETSIKIDELRAIRKEVYEPPYDADVRVILIDDADLMTREAANALLKTLEEPPPSNLFILVTSREQDILTTIRSRCMRIGFGPLSTGAVALYLQEHLNLEADRAQLFAALSSGSIASALFWLDEKNLLLRRRIAETVVSKKGSLTNASLIAERIAKEGTEPQYLSFLLSFFRDKWWLDHTGDLSGLTNRDLQQVIEESAVGRHAWVDASIAMILETMKTLRYALNRWLALENMMIGLVRHA
jgi:DNA polymerase-3 subunit delta'